MTVDNIALAGLAFLIPVMVGLGVWVIRQAAKPSGKK